MTKVEFLLALFVLISLTACIVGGAPERFLGAIFLAWIPLDRIEHQLFGPPTYLHVDPFHMAMDTIVFILLVWLALMGPVRGRLVQLLIALMIAATLAARCPTVAEAAAIAARPPTGSLRGSRWPFARRRPGGT